MTGARDHLEHHDTRAAGATARKAHDLASGSVISGRADPRLSQAGGAEELMHLQRSVGNAAVSGLVAPTLQREVAIDEISTEVPPTASSPDAGGGTVTSDGATTTITGATISLNAPMTQTDGIIRADTIIANTVVGSSYTPGAGNEW